MTYRKVVNQKGKPRGRGRPITQSEVEGYIEMRSEGATCEEIGVIFDRAPESVRRKLSASGNSARLIRKIRIEGDVAYIPLTQDREAIIDAIDVDVVSGRNWHFSLGGRRSSSGGYACSEIGGKQVQMHRLIHGTPDGLFTDHINHNGLDNRRANLRSVSKRGNAMNARRGRGGALPRGVSEDRRGGKFTWMISCSGFDTPEAASAARLNALRTLYGEDLIEPTEKLVEAA